MIEHPLVLEGERVRLEPLLPAHIPPLLSISKAAPETYRYTSTPTTDAEAEAYFGRAFEEREAGTAYPFVLLVGGGVVGTSRYHTLDHKNRSCEIGFTWLAPRMQGTGVNAESKYLMLKYAFGVLEFLRVQFHTDTRNVQSQKAIKRLGAVYEGTLRAERVMKDGYIRDSMIFSIIHTEWPEVKRTLEARLGYARPV